MVWKKMSTTRFWGEPDDGVEVRHAEGGHLYGICLKIWGELGEIDGRRVQNGGGL